ncbi:TRAP transporter small permease [Salinisphaera orenii]|uniref:TRAP transporter small permease protein n=1 Tax=Salinisphaera orenii YIM 95161 TaxID=1051139 RepID=A0A423PHP4_9GAMM|nr:TRAP transporter small permease [Salinisphaera halophila]ROO25159.1 hypothetical protein SAHL_15100 [Salinisphaera halophila YIM 95161]
MKLLIRIHAGAERALFMLAAATLVVMMALVSADVVARYVFNAPLSFQFELTTNYLMVMVATIALPWCERRGAFIRLSVAGRLLGPRGRRVLHAAGALAAAAIMAAIAWYSGWRTVDKYQSGDAIFGVIDWPVWASLVWVPIGCGMLALRLLVRAATDIVAPESGEPEAGGRASSEVHS